MNIWQHYKQTWADICRDSGALLLLFGAGLVYSFFYPLPYQYEQVEQVPVILVDQDQSPSSRTLSRLLEAAPALAITQIDNNPDGINQQLWRGEVMALMIIPSGFHDDMLSGRQANFQVASHGGYLLAGSKALMSASEAALTMGAAISVSKLQAQGADSFAARAGVQPIQLEVRQLYNQNDGYGHAIVPAVMVLIIQQTLLIGVTLLLGRQAELQRLPTTVASYLGTLLAFTTIGLLNCLYFFAIALDVQHYAATASLVDLVVFSLLFSLCISAFALLLARCFSTRERGLQLLLITSIPMLFLSGYSWPAESLPDLLSVIRWLLPTTAGIHGFVGINQLGASLADVAFEGLVLAGLSAVLISAGLLVYRPRPPR